MKKCSTLACRLFYLSLLAIITSSVFGQTANQYGYSTSIPGALITQTSPTTIVAAGVDDNVSTLQNIGFTFNYEGTNYTQFTASPDGWIKLGSTVGTNQYTNAVTSTTNIPKLFAFWDDLATGTGGYVRYSVEGTAPNRILVVEWFVTIPRNTTGAANSVFQEQLYETTNVIQFVYGTIGGTTTSASLGINGAVATNFISISTPANTSSTVTANDGNTAWPGTDTVYTFTPPAACAGAPVAGTAVSSSPNVCPNTSFSVSLNGASVATGLNFQWFSSTDGVNYTAIGGATSSSYSTTLTDSAYFKCSVTCVASGLSDTSSAVLVRVNPAYLCYCVSGIGGVCTGAEAEIDNVNILGTTLNNNSGCAAPVGGDYYTSYPDTGSATCTLLQGVQYTFGMTMNGAGIASVWIDYDHSGTFDASEWTQVTTNGTVVTVNIQVPLNAMLGTTGMRVRSRLTGNTNGAVNACTNFGSGETEDYLVTIGPQPVCTNPPTAGTISGPGSVCATTSFTLTLTGQTLGTVVQWQSSTDSIIWSDVAGQNNATYTTSITSGPVFYRVKVTCADSAFTNVIRVGLNAPGLCLCTPPATNCNSSDEITNVTFDVINNTTACSANGYSSYTTPVPVLYKGLTYPIAVTVTNGGTEYTAAWIDYNQNGIFDTSEYTSIGSGAGGVTFTNNISIPLGATNGVTTLRVRDRYNTALANTDACIGYTYGETEDYLVDIEDVPNCTNPPVAGYISGDTSTCVGISLTLSLTNFTLGTSLQWQVSSDSVSWSSIPGATQYQYNTDPITDTIYYRVMVICADTSYTNAFGVTLRGQFDCYCTVSGSDCSFDDVIDSVAFAGINNATGCSPTGYTMYTNPTGFVYQGAPYNLAVTVGNGGGENVAVWIDFNHDYTFEPNEYTFVGSSTVLATLIASINIPANADTGYTLMRITDAYNTVPGPGDACIPFAYGETEDYVIYISTPPACTTPTVAGTITGPTTVFTGTQYLYTSTTSTGDVQWQYSATSASGPYTSFGGANADSLYLTFNGPGTYYIRTFVTTPGCDPDSSNVLTVVASKLGDDVCTAIPLSFGTNGYFDLTGATTQAGEPSPPGGNCQVQNGWCNTTLTFTMWFTFVAPASGRVSLQSPDFDTQLALWDAANCDTILNNGATLIQANDDDPDYLTHNGVDFSSYIDSAICLTPGKTYYVQLDAYSSFTPDSTRIVLTDLGPGPDATFNTLAPVYCTSAAPVALVGNTPGGVFSGPGVTDTTFTPSDATAGGPYIISYSFYACYAASDTLSVIGGPVISIDSTVNVLCGGDSSGAIQISVTGAGSPTYAWDNGAVTEDLTGIPAGAYMLTVTDTTSCFASITDTITQPDPLNPQLDSLINVSCNGMANGGIYISVTGGVLPYTFTWSNGTHNEDATGLSGGVYTLQLIDSNNCVFNSPTVPIVEPAALNIALDSTVNIVCHGDHSGGVYVTVSGGTTPYTYNWTNGATTEDNTGINGGTYTLAVVDSNGCTVTGAADSVAEPTVVKINLDSASNVLCFGVNTGSIYVDVSGGVPGYSYLWSNSATTEDLPSLSGGNYTLTATDTHGCSATFTLGVNSPSSAVTASSSVTDQMQGGALGSITLTTAGGTTPYFYSWNNGSTDTTLTGLTAGVYTCTITDGGGCTLVVTDTVDLILGLHDVSGLYDLSVYPNPTQSQVFINLKLTNASHVVVDIYNVNGQLEQEFNQTDVTVAKYAMDFTNKAAGVYTAKIKIGDEIVIKRIVVTR